MSIVTVAMLIMVTTFGISNVIDNLVEMGLASIPSWFVVGVLYFLPLALILAEFASDTKQSGGIYNFMERGIGPTWAFVGTWSYFVANLVYLQSSFSRLPIRISLAVSGVDVFQSAAVLLPLFGLLVCIALTYLACRGVRFFSHLTDWAGKGILVLVAGLILVPLVLLVSGGLVPANEFTREALIPRLDLDYFSTFSWLLFAVAGAEVAAPYVNDTHDPVHNFPRAILLSTLLIAAMYVLASIAVALIFPLGELTKATGLFDIWINWASLIGLPGVLVAKFCIGFIVVVSVAAFVVWAESPIRVMFAEVPKGTFPAALTRHDAAGTHQQALWIQAAVVSVLILIPLASILTGMSGSERFLGLLNDLASLSLVVPYMFVALAYIQARRNGMDAPFKMTRSTPLAIAIGVTVLLVSAFGYLGAGLFALQADPIDWIYVGIVYGGPWVLIGLGMALRALSLQAFRGAAGAGR
jgi:amino acid transporter